LWQGFGAVWKIILVVSLVPLIVALMGRRLLYHRVMLDLEEKQVESSVDARLLAERLCGEKPEGRLVKKWEGERSMDVCGAAALWAGMRLYKKENPQAVGVREEAVKFGMVGPIFTFVIMVFAVVVGKLAMGWVLSILVGVLGLSVVFLMLTQSVELRH